MMKKVLITGANGLLGEACCRILENDDRYHVIPLVRSDVNLAHLSSLSEYLNKLEFDVLINTAAMSGLEQCLDNPVLASVINTDAPEVMATICRTKGAKMIQISTDYVLNGSEEKAHSDIGETMTYASGVYSSTKLAAEEAVLKVSGFHVVARVSWLFGHGRETFVDQVVRAASEGQKSSYVEDKFSVPNFCDDLVIALKSLVESDVHGIFHLTNPAETESWYSYAEKVIEIAKDIGVIDDFPVRMSPQKLDDISSFKEVRPRFTVMLPQRLREECDLEVGNWQNGVRVYLAQKYGNSLTS